MILTCPECATSYFVDDDRIPMGGRKVKCANCGARWTAALDPSPANRHPEEAEFAAMIAAEPIAEPVAEPDDVYDDLEVEAAEAEAAETDSAEAPLVASPLHPAPAKAPQGLSASLVVLMVLAALSLLIAGLVLVRGPIARAMPATAPLFEALGMKARTTDLAIEGVHSQAAFQGETPVLTVTGAVRNAASAAQPAPPIRVRLKDRAGKIVAQRTATPADAAVPAHATRYFAVIVPNPPSTSAGLEVDFTAEPAPAKGAEAKPANH
jgi:predicted Zn finger-like uncharacterized protein